MKIPLKLTKNTTCFGFNRRLHLLPVERRFPDGRRWSWVFEFYKNVRGIPEHCRWHRRPSPPRACWTTESDCRCQSPSPRDERQRWVNTQTKRTLKIKRGKEKRKGEKIHPTSWSIFLSRKTSITSTVATHFRFFQDSVPPPSPFPFQTQWQKEKASGMATPVSGSETRGGGGKILFSKWRKADSILRFTWIFQSFELLGNSRNDEISILLFKTCFPYRFGLFAQSRSFRNPNSLAEGHGLCKGTTLHNRKKNPAYYS